MKLRIQHEKTKHSIEIADDANIATLLGLIESRINVAKFSIKIGFPPKILDITETQQTLKDAKIRSGESLIVESTGDAGPRQQQTSTCSIKPKESVETKQAIYSPPTPDTRKREVLQDSFSFGGRAAKKDAEHDETSPPEIEVPGRGRIVLRVQPDDNSCLFRAIGYLCMRSIDSMQELRALIATTIQDKPEVYSDAVLGMRRDLYCSKMNRADTWGGEIELTILSEHFKVAIKNIDCQTGHIYNYGEEYDDAIYIVYSGIHYDAIAMSPAEDAPPDWDQTQFSSTDTVVQKAAQDLVAVLRKRSYFTDTSNFALRCHDCGIGLRGEKDAQAHAVKTKHVNFGEYKE